MKVILNNVTELTPIIVTGEKRNVHGENRDCLTFVFDDVSMDAIDGLFTDQNCERVVIVESGTKIVNKEVLNEETGETVVVEEEVPAEIEHLHVGYTIRVDLSKTVEIKKRSTSTTPAECVNRVSVTMAQRTYTETKIAENTAVLNALLGE